MPTTEQISNFDDSPLDELETERVREIVNLTLNEVEGLEALLAGLKGAQYQWLRSMIALWDEIGDDTARITGGRDALDADSERSRELVRRRVRNFLGLPEITGAQTLDNNQLIGSFTYKRKWTRKRC